MVFHAHMAASVRGLASGSALLLKLKEGAFSVLARRMPPQGKVQRVHRVKVRLLGAVSEATNETMHQRFFFRNGIAQ